MKLPVLAELVNDNQSAGATIERICHGAEELALIIRCAFRRDGIEFFTPPDRPLQVGYMNRPAGHFIAPHVHNPVAHSSVAHNAESSKEVLFVRSGKARVDFYSRAQEYLESTILETGDVILLARGGHGFEMLEPTEMIEVRNGAYYAKQDKTRFEPIAQEKVKLRSART